MNASAANARVSCSPGQRGPSPASPDPREPIAVLADVLERDGAELSATGIKRRNLANADHLAVLNAIWTAETREARNDHYRQLVMAALPPGYQQELSHQGQMAVPHAAGCRTGRAGPRRGHPVPPSHLRTWPAPVTSPASSTPGSASASTRWSLSRRAPGPVAFPTCPTQTARLIWPRSPP